MGKVHHQLCKATVRPEQKTERTGFEHVRYWVILDITGETQAGRGCDPAHCKEYL